MKPFWFTLLLLTCSLHAEDLDFGPQDPNAEKLVQQLGSEDFAIRTQAMDALKNLGVKAGVALKAGAASGDLEIKTRASLLLPRAEEYVYGRKAFECWKASLKKAWPEALKEGRLCGPLFGASELGPLPHSIEKEELKEVEEGSNFLASVQEEDGHWDSRKFGAQLNADVEQTALAVLAFTEAGHTEKIGRHKANVKNALNWLMQHQREDGAILSFGWDEPDGVVHALAGLALCEAAACKDSSPEIKACAQKALDYSVNRHQERKTDDLEDEYNAFGFGRSARSKSDLFTTGLFAMQLNAGHQAGLKIKQRGFDGIIKFLDSIKSTSDAESSNQGNPGLYTWVPEGKESVEATWMALMVRGRMGWKHEDLTGSALLAAKVFNEPSMGTATSDVLFNYLALEVMIRQGGEVWTNWKNQNYKMCTDAQRIQGIGGGSWDPAGVWMGSGRIANTAFPALSLIVIYRRINFLKK